jgi:transcription antitermination factor NusG
MTVIPNNSNSIGLNVSVSASRAAKHETFTRASIQEGLGALEQVCDITTNALSVRDWFATYTSPRHEKRVAAHLESLAIDCFLPLYRTVRRWKNGCRVPLTLPLFPSYVFVHISRVERIRVLQVPGIVSIVSNGPNPMTIPASDIELLRDRIDRLENIQPHPYLAIGDHVRITAGPLTGLHGILVRKKNELRIVITVEAIMKSFSIETDADAVEPVRTSIAQPDMRFSS